MKKRKIFAVILAFVLMMAAFSGCGVIESLFGGEPPAQEQPSDPEDPQDPQDPPEEEPSDPEEPQQPPVTVMDAADRYAAEPVRNVMDDMTSYRDGNASATIPFRKRYPPNCSTRQPARCQEYTTCMTSIAD